MEIPDRMETTIQDEPVSAEPPANGENLPSSSAAAESAQPAPDPIAELKSQLEAVNAKAAEYLDGWQRARAEFANYKKRVERDNADLSQNLTAEVLARFLPVLDDFSRAMKNAPADGDGAQWAAGIALVHKKFNALLESNNIKRIEADGQTFDPNLHEAIVHEDSPDHESGKVIEVLRQGYKLGERVLRPALVKVAK
jgi:molecular chaperone GrpE